jgi:hypothetical protein
LSGTEYMLLTGRVNFGLIQLCLRMVPSYLRDSAGQDAGSANGGNDG